MDRLHALQKAHKQKHVKNLSAPPIINITPATPATPAEEPQITVFTSEPDEISPTAEFPTITVESPDNVNHSKGNSLADELQRAADGRNSSPSQTQGGSAQHTWNGSDGLLSPDSRSNPRRHSLPNLKQLGKEIKKIESTMASVPMGKLQIDIISMHTNMPKIRQPQVRLRLGGQIYFSTVSNSPTGDWNEGFIFSVSYHAQLFDSIDVDLYDKRRWKKKHKHLAKAKLRLSKLEMKPEVFLTILPLYEYHSRLHILPHLRDKNKENRHDESEDPPSTSQGPPPDSILKEHHDALSFIAAQDIETEPWSFDSLYDHRQPTPPLVGSIRIRMRYAYQHPRIDQQDVDYWMPVLSDNASLLSVDPDDDDASSITSDVTSEAGSDIGSMYSELELGEGDHHEPRVWETDNRSEAADDANTDGQEIRPEDMVRDENVVEKEFEAKLSEALEKSRGRHPLDTSDVKTDGTKPPQDRDSRPPSRSNSRPTSPPLNGIDMNGSILSRTASNASQRAPPHREGSITPSVIDLLQYGFSRRDADARSMAGDSVHSSSTDFSIRSGVFADKDFAKKWMMDSFEEAVMANPTMDWMIGMVVSPETRTLLRAVSKLASAFGQGFKVNYMQLMTGITVMEKFYAEQPRQLPRSQVINLELVETVNHYFKHAVIAYGWRGLGYLGKYTRPIKDVIRLRSNRNAIIRYLRIPPEDLLGYEYGIRKGAAFHPSYFVALDRPQGAVVLGIRGTWSLYDAITDLVCEYRPWKEGLAHSGMLASAQWFFTHIIPQIFNYVHNSPVMLNSLIITGHSLGAGTAAILTMMVVDHLEELHHLSGNPNFKVHSYGFGPVAATSYELGQRYKEYIDAFVTQDDLVGRMSYGTAMELKEMIVGTINAVEDVGGASKFNKDAEAKEHVFERMTQLRTEIYESHVKSYPLLYIPGNIYQFIRHTPDKPPAIFHPPAASWSSRSGSVKEAAAEEVTITMHPVHKRICEEILVTRTCMEDHSLLNYLTSLRKAREACMRYVRAQALKKAEEARLAREEGKEMEEVELEEDAEEMLEGPDGLVPMITVEGPDGEEGNVLFAEGGQNGKKFLKKIFRKKKDKVPTANEVY